MKYAYSLTALLFIGMSVTAFSHPHFSKSLKATLPSKVEASVSYYTVPANMSHIEKIKVGGFVPSHATLSLSGAASSGSTSVSAGEYTIGAIRGSTDWTLVLHPKLAQGHTPDPSKLIRLESWFFNFRGNSPPFLLRCDAGTWKPGGEGHPHLAFREPLLGRGPGVAQTGGQESLPGVLPGPEGGSFHPEDFEILRVTL